MTPEQAVDKVYAATGVLLGTDKAPHIASYMTVMETRIAELEAALDDALTYVWRAHGWSKLKPETQAYEFRKKE